MRLSAFAFFTTARQIVEVHTIHSIPLQTFCWQSQRCCNRLSHDCKALSVLINEAEDRLRELRDGSEAAIEKISEELASEIISKISKEK